MRGPVVLLAPAEPPQSTVAYSAVPRAGYSCKRAVKRELALIDRGQLSRSSRVAALIVLTTYITDSAKNSAPTAALTCSLRSGVR